MAVEMTIVKVTLRTSATLASRKRTLILVVTVVVVGAVVAANFAH